MSVEIERKFAVTALPPREFLQNLTIIHQGYLVIGENGDEVRLRQARDSYTGVETHTQTVKTRGGLVRGELEIDLSVDQFKALWPATKGKQLLKNRYTTEHRGQVYEIDSYIGQLSGLTVLEVEFVDESEAGLFVPPVWVGDELTDLSKFKNQNLATRENPPIGSFVTRAGKEIIIPYLDLQSEMLK